MVNLSVSHGVGTVWVDYTKVNFYSSSLSLPSIKYFKYKRFGNTSQFLLFHLVLYMD